MKQARCARLALACGLAIGAAGASAQTYEQGGAEIRFQIFNPTTQAWVSSYADGVAGQQIEWRVVVSYTGTRTDMFALGEALYQPTIRNADNADNGDGLDNLGAWRNGGNGGDTVSGSMLTAVEGENGSPLPTYGRVRFGGTQTAVTGSNTLTTFRHSGGSNMAPPGDWLRVAGSFVSQWPQPLPGTTDATNINRILRGVSAAQLAQVAAPQYHVVGTQSLIIFRQAIILSNSAEVRQLEIGTFHESFRRVGSTSSTDNRRYIRWQTSIFQQDLGNRTLDPTIVPATIWVNIPAPGVGALCGVVLLGAARRGRGVPCDRLECGS